MPPAASQLQSRFDPARDAQWRAALPSWLLSLILHGALLITMALLFKVAPRGTGAEITRTVGVVLKHSSDQGESSFYTDESSQQFVAEAASSPSTNPLDEAQSIRPSEALPSEKDVVGLGAGNPEGSSLPGASGLLTGPGASRSLPGGRARTQVFGIPAEGFKFVYVFDRSASMGGRPLNRAKAELLASLESLGELHQFQIIFYNDQPTMFSLAGQPGKLIFGNEPNKRQAQQFINGIIADRGTEREPALLAALNLAPDVIFFLGDSDDPELNSGQLAKIAARNRRGTVINVIEFGHGPQLGENFLKKLARQNGGSYAYVDTAR